MTPGQIGLPAGRIRFGSRYRANFLSAFLLVGVLAGCAFDPPTIQRTPREAAGTENNAKSRLAARKGTPGSTAPAPGAASAGELGVPGDEVAALEVDLTNFKERLIGLDSDEINDLLGTPGLERAEPPALIWQYRHTSCTVDIFMFDDGGGATVDHVEVRPGQGPAVDEKACFTSLLRNTKSAAMPRGQQPVSPSPSIPVGRGTDGPPSRSGPASAAPPPRPTAPGASPAAPASPGDMDDVSPKDTHVDFDFSTPPAAAPMNIPAPKSEAAPPAPAVPAASTPAALPPRASAIPSKDDDLDIDMSSPAPGPAALPPRASAPPSKDDDLDIDMSSPAPGPAAPPAAARAPTPPTAPAPAARAATPLVPPAQTRTVAAAPKAAAKTVETVDDEDLPPDLLRGGRADDDPANTNEDMVE